MIRLIFASDMHGSDICFRKFISAALTYKVDVAITSELTGKFIVPVIEYPDGSYEAVFQDTTIKVKRKEELEEKVERNAKAVGMYTYYLKAEEYEKFKELGGFKETPEVDKIFHEKISERLTDWVKLAEEKLGNTNIKFFMMPGNDDFQYVDEIIESSSYVKNLEGKVYDIGERWQLGGTGYSNITPWKCPRDVPEDELFNRLESLAAQVTDMNHFVLHTHCPPYDTKLDQAPQLDENLKVVYKGGGTMLVPVGSTAVRKFIEKYQFPLGLHGHIHESRAVDRIGKTLVINPGSEYITGTLSAVLVNLDEKGVKGYRFILT
ncbi:MAG: hypothetical protein QXL69_04725 [Candidatus Bathyarchaeia archaeon]|nr:hypothetical protein [Candidatus Bathyarchaeota archaeon]